MKLIFSLNAQFFRQKRRYANLVLELQTLSFIFLYILVLFTIVSGHRLSDNIFLWFLMITNPYSTWSGSLSAMAISTTIISDLIFAGLMAWQNERINNSQTFHLLALSTNQVWLVNLFSSLLACAYLFIIQVVVSWLLSLPTMILDIKINPWLNLISFLAFQNADGNLGDVLVTLVGLTLLIFVSVTFVNYSSKTIEDFLPTKNNRWLHFVLIALIAVIGIYFALQINDYLTSIFVHDVYIPHKNGGEEIIGNPMWLENIEAWVGVLVITILDLWLGHKFWEPKRDQ